MQLTKTNRWLLLFLFGSLWGIMEVVGGESFFKNAVPQASAVDLMVTGLARKLRPLGGVLAGITTPFVANTAFGIFMAFIVKYKYWAVEGWPKVIKHIVVSGGLAALAGAVLVPLGFWLGNNIEALNLRKP